MSMTTVRISGEFTAFELASLVAFIRDLDHDQRHWEVTVSTGGEIIAEAEALLRKVVPEAPGRVTRFEAHRKQ
jgi:hypothetical protein